MLKKPKQVEKEKEAPKEGVKLKPIPAKDVPAEEKKDEVKLKPVPAKEKEVRNWALSFLLYRITLVHSTHLPSVHMLSYTYRHEYLGTQGYTKQNPRQKGKHREGGPTGDDSN